MIAATATAAAPPRPVPGTLPSPALPVFAAAVSGVVDASHPGALFRRGGSGAIAAAGPPIPRPGQQDWVALGAGAGDSCRSPAGTSGLQVCARPTPGLTRKRIVVVGDSHAQQFAGAVEETARQHDWQIFSILRGSCPFSTTSETAPGSRGCVAWNAAAIAEIVRMRPDAVVTTATRDARVGLTETTPSGFVEAWRQLDEAGIPVLAVRDNPRFAAPPWACIERHGAEDPRCAVQRSAVLAPVAPYRRLLDVPDNVAFVDAGDYFCTPAVCPPVVGNVLVYFDDNHVSATFTRSLGPVVAAQLVPMVDG